MAYTPTQGVFVDGAIIDAADFNTEFALISSGMAQDKDELTQAISDSLNSANQYTDSAIAALNFDGGTF